MAVTFRSVYQIAYLPAVNLRSLKRLSHHSQRNFRTGMGAAWIAQTKQKPAYQMLVRVQIGSLHVDPRGRVPLTRHILPFEIPVPSTTLSDQIYSNNDQLKSLIVAMRSRGMSYRQIGVTLGLHWTRIGQIINGH